EGDILEGRKLANKLWNASRLLLQAGVSEVAARPSSLEERWILARLSQTQSAVEASLKAFDFSHLVQELYHLTFDDFCDWYLEGDILEGRKLANKLWNASRLLLQAGVSEVAARPSSLEERWILARLSQTQSAVEASLKAFDFSHLVQELYHLTFDDFCDWYLE